MIHGVLNVNKPAGMTSRRVVDRVRRVAGMRKAGHAGTLDPDATGVLLVCLGDATKLFNALQEGDKEYAGTIVLGVETDTQDASGSYTAIGDPYTVTQEKIEEVFPRFVGEVRQVPPMFSAVKHKGQRLYDLARQGIQVEREARYIQVYEMEILWIEVPELRFRVVCSKGTYVRTLAADIGRELGCGAHLRDLVRTRSGAFELEDAVELEGLDTEALYDYTRPVDEILTLLHSDSEW